VVDEASEGLELPCEDRRLRDAKGLPSTTQFGRLRRPDRLADLAVFPQPLVALQGPVDRANLRGGVLGPGRGLPLIGAGLRSLLRPMGP
jgi:hypothetical protein